MLNPLNEYSWAFPIVECVHIFGIVCGVGTAAIVNLHLLGVGPNRCRGMRLWADLRPWTLAGLSLAIFSGLLLFSIDPELYYRNPAFRFKMLSLLLAIGFYYTIVRKTVSGERTRGRSLIAYTSLALWTLVPLGGIFIGLVGSQSA